MSALAVRAGRGRADHALVFDGDEEIVFQWATRNAPARRTVSVCGWRGVVPTGLPFDPARGTACRRCVELLNGAT